MTQAQAHAKERLFFNENRVDPSTSTRIPYACVRLHCLKTKICFVWPIKALVADSPLLSILTKWRMLWLVLKLMSTFLFISISHLCLKTRLYGLPMGSQILLDEVLRSRHRFNDIKFVKSAFFAEISTPFPSFQ